MKKILLMLIMSVFVFAGCSSDEDEGNEVGVSLVGKTYAGQVIQPTTLWPDGVYWNFRFISDSQVEKTSRKGSPTGSISGDPVVIKYDFEYPNITFHIPNPTEDGTYEYSGVFVNETCFRVKTKTGYDEFYRQ